MTSTVSVIIPVFNGRAFIARAINSVLRQTYVAAEIIIVNDGSTDGTLEAIADFGSKIKVISTPNRGVSSARNTGVAASTSPLIAFLDADDEWYDDKLEQQVKFIQQHPQAGVCCCDYHLDNDGIRAHRTRFAELIRRRGGSTEWWSRHPLITLINENFVGTTSAVLLRRDVWDSTGGFNPNYKQAEDYDLWIRCALLTKFAVMPDILMRKIGHDQNLTNSPIETFRYHEVVLSDHCNLDSFKSPKEMKPHAVFALSRTRYHLANLLIDEKKYRDGWRYYRKGLLTERSARNMNFFVYCLVRKIVQVMAYKILRVHPARHNARPVN